MRSASLSRWLLFFPLAALTCLGADETADRRARDPRQIATALSARYGQAMGEVSYIPALALIGRLEVAGWTADANAVAEVGRIAAGAKTPSERLLPGPVLAGHLIHARLGLKDRVAGVLGAAFDAEGKPAGFLPNHGRMSDSVFMDCPLLAAAARLTGDARFLRVCGNHYEFMRGLCLREDGLWRHSPLNEAAWGRGNGFPALGLALVLREVAPGSEEERRYREALRAHLEALLPFQDDQGLWHQVIDHPESYPEFSATCMIGIAVHQGLREGWLDRDRFGGAGDRAWEAVKGRIGLDGERVEGVCTGTGAMKTLEEYLRRPAIFGRDDRGGAMALLFAVERDARERRRGR